MAKQDFKYEGVGYNGPHLAAMPYDQFKKEVEHHFKDGPNQEDRMKALHEKLVAKYPATQKGTKFVIPTDEAELAKPLSERTAIVEEAKPEVKPAQPGGVAQVASLLPDTGAEKK